MGRLSIRKEHDLPLTEASGLCVFEWDSHESLAVVGDRNNQVAVARLGEQGEPGEWTVLDLDSLSDVPENLGQRTLVEIDPPPMHRRR